MSVSARNTIEKRSLNPNNGKYFQEIYGFMAITKIQKKKQMRNIKYDQKTDRRKKL